MFDENIFPLKTSLRYNEHKATCCDLNVDTFAQFYLEDALMFSLTTAISINMLFET